MRSLKELCGDFFRPSSPDRADLTLTSLALALRAYAGTSRAIHGYLHLTEPATGAEQATRDAALGTRYREAAFETIIHLQHFAELVLKQALRAEHELLALVDDIDHNLLHRLVKGGVVKPSDEANLHTIDARVALERVCAIVQSGHLTQYAFIPKHRDFLQQLNGLRNRLWHRGAIVLRYRALDELVGHYALPFIDDVIALSEYSSSKRIWSHEPLHCGLDPFPLIRKELASASWNVKKVAFLKELARAAFLNPMEGDPWFDQENDERKQRGALLASAPMDANAAHDVKRCPVCGVEALVRYETSIDTGDADEDGYAPSENWTFSARCEVCSLELSDSYGNPSDHGWAFGDLWSRV